MHAYSSIIQRDSEEQLIELWPFAVEGASFRDIYQEKMERVKEQVRSNRLSSTIGGNREMNQLYTTSQVSNITRKTKFSHIS